MTATDQKTLSIPQAMKLAAKHHNAGDLSKAEAIYQNILAAKPDHANATHLLGVIAHQKGKYELAINLISNAITLQPNLAEAHNNLGIVQQKSSRLEEAIINYRKALELKPDFAQAHGNLGLAFKDLGRLEDAISCYRNALDFKPDFTEALCNLGNALRQLNRLQEAIACYEKALFFQPDYLTAYISLGSILRDVGKLEDAMSIYRKALEVKPDYAPAHNNLGNVLLTLQKPQEAAESFQKALRINPQDVDALNNLGAAFYELGKTDDAIIFYQKALNLRPEYAEAHNNLGSLLRDLGEIEEAEAQFRAATTFKPKLAAAHYNLGNILKNRGQPDESLFSYRKALQLNSKFAEAHNGLGSALKETGRLKEAATSYENALELEPNLPEARVNLGMLQLLMGNFSPGWKNYQWRRKLREYEFHPRKYPQPAWDGESIEGKTVFIHPEQGFGDFFQFVRYVPLVMALGSKVILETPPQVARLVTEMDLANTIVTGDQSVPEFEYHSALMDLPRILNTTLGNIPCNTPYVTVSNNIKEEWRERLGPKNRPRIGLVWAGNPRHPKLAHKSIDVKFLTPLIKAPDVEVFSLQKDRETEIPRDLVNHLVDLSPKLTDFAETAGAISQLDLIISVDTSVAHLAGALGQPVWTLLPYHADWRWLIEREDSPWYPTMRLFRQASRGDWKTVIEKIEIALFENKKIKPDQFSRTQN